MTDSAKPGETSSRWWEFYAVRYAMGTVVGAIVFCFLCRGTPLEFLLRGTPLEPLIHGTAASPTPAEPSDTYTLKLEASHSRSAGPPRAYSIKLEASRSSSAPATSIAADAIRLDVTHLALLAVCGLVYCYIASAPILVLHAGRFLSGRWIKLTSRWVKCLSVVLVVVLFPLSPLVAYGVLGRLESWRYCIIGYFAVAGLLVIVLQYVVSSWALIESRHLFAFYGTLAENREIALSPERARGGIVDSYRHLREHGNSFFIVLLEILLAAILVGARLIVSNESDPSSLGYLVVIVAWVFPAACVWGIGTLFEREFSESYSGKG